MKKSAIASIIAIVVALTCLLGVVGCERKSMDDSTANNPSATGIDSGDISSISGLKMSKKLNESNGKYVIPLWQRSTVRVRETSSRANRAMFIWK